MVGVGTSLNTNCPPYSNNLTAFMRALLESAQWAPRARARWLATLDRIRKGRVVKPLHDFSVFEEEHACAMPGFDLEASEVVNPLVNYHWSASPGFEYLEALHVTHEAPNRVLHGLSSRSEERRVGKEWRARSAAEDNRAKQMR